MAVNKVFPRSLSKSKDTRFRKKTEMSDALNLRATESVDAFVNNFNTGAAEQGSQGDAGGEISPTGNMGVLKPVAGNIANMESGINAGTGGDEGGAFTNHSIIGSVSDEARGHITFLFGTTTSLKIVWI